MKPYHVKRRVVQLTVLILLCAIPVLGVFRIDLASASFVFFGRPIWWDNYQFLSGMALAILSAPLLTYVTIGSLWCGWACPQNLLTEWADALTFKWLGKRADVRVDGQGLVLAPDKNRWLNWLKLGATLLTASFFLGLVVLKLYYPAQDVWGFLWGTTTRQANFAIMLAFVVFFVFIDLAVVRYFLCDYACFYRMGQRLFQTRAALHVEHDGARVADCEKCHYCATVCPTRIEPNRIQKHDICIDCGECIDACDRLHLKEGTAGLLNFSTRSSAPQTGRQHSGLRLTLLRGGAGFLFLGGCALMGWGAWTQKTVDFQKMEADQEQLRVIAHHCQPRCAPLQVQCRGDHLAACYQAAACTCACSLEQDPTNPQRDTWQQCVRLNQKHLQALETASFPQVRR